MSLAYDIMTQQVPHPRAIPAAIPLHRPVMPPAQARLLGGAMRGSLARSDPWYGAARRITPP